jgi:hypothetical protein
MRRFNFEDFRRHSGSSFDSPRRRAARGRPEDVAGRRLAVVLVWSVLGVGLVLSLLLLFGPPGGRPSVAQAGTAPAERRPVVTVAPARPAPAGWGLALPYLHVEVHVRLDRPRPPVRVPAAAVLHRLGETQVAVVGPDGALRYRTVRLGRPLGQEVEVVAGLRPDDAVVTDMPAGLRDGTTVRTAPASGETGS